jgi:hypothetical protein
MMFARASVPAWFVILALGAFLAPAGMVTTVLLVALGLACIPAVISGGICKRTASGDLKVSGYRETPLVKDGEMLAIDDRQSAAIDAEFTVERAGPTGHQRG